MFYEAEAGELNLIAVGDTLWVRPMSMFREKSFLELVDLIRSADAAFCNLEILFHNYEMPAGAKPSVSYTVGDPRILEELKWIGFGMTSVPHHHWDYGTEGLLATARHVDEAGLLLAGAGRNLAEARAPVYLETPKGRVALLACLGTFADAGRAGEQRPDHMGRPGVSFLRHKMVRYVDRPSFEALRRMSEKLGMEMDKEHQRHMSSFLSGHPVPEDTDAEFHFMGSTFRLAEEFSVTSVPNEEDMNDILRWVREARRQADWVLMSLHSHDHGTGLEDPAHFMESFARRCIDEGVDAFLGHGAHFIRGMEIYKGKPIFYGLSQFVFQNEAYAWLPAEAYSRFGLGHYNTPADVNDAKTGVHTPGVQLERIYWQGLVTQTLFKGWELEEVRLYVVDQGYGQPRSRHGRPVLADKEVATKALERMARLSAPYGTEISIKDGVGYVRP